MTAERKPGSAGAGQLPFRTSADTDGEVRRVLEKLEASGLDIPIVKLLANSSAGFRPYILMSDALMNRGAFPPLERELVILLLAATRATAYEWDEHVPMSARAGVTDEQRAAIATGDVDAKELFTEPQRLALRLGAVLWADGFLGEVDWEEATAAWGPEGALDLVLIVAWWGHAVPALITAFGLGGRGPSAAGEAR
jgi:alkylhydroperoxidase family enzyme